ncbi:MAG: NUDIX domain-containing protein [bacterium]
MDRTDVVTAFLRREDGAILLARRSDEVKTYNQRWAAISGYLETTDPLLQAEREVREETGLNRDQFELARKGYPLAVDDDSNDKSWRVHPFCFALGEPVPEITIDREHTTFRWYQPDEIEDLSTVPALQLAWKRVRSG